MKLALFAADGLYAIVPCDHCTDGACVHDRGTDPDWCCKCDGQGEEWIFIDWLYNLARAIAIAGALCASFEAGGAFHAQWSWYRQGGYWHPLCGRPFNMEG